MRKLALYWHTVRHLRPVQIYGRFLRRRPTVSLLPAPALRVRDGATCAGCSRTGGWLGGRRFRFLNSEREIVSWNDAGVPKLWLYNLHYQYGVTLELMEWWMAENPPGQGNGWEPYPLSLRIGNWLLWILQGGVASEEILQSLATQVRYLRGSIEWHLQGNHLFVNGKALVMAGTLFAGSEAAEWRRVGMEIVTQGLREQVLADGGHFERTPMYHALAFEDVLDLMNVGGLALGEVAGRMWGWLEQLTHPDGALSFFNDATGGVAPELGELAGYAERLGVVKRRVPLGESGFARLEADGVTVLMDAGSVGPSYQPGHAHAETLSIEVCIAGKRVVVNQGISTYEKNEQRQWERGTGAHSTVRVEGADSSEVWGGFRVARRARVTDRSEDGRVWVAAAHDGYRGVRHWRKVSLTAGRVEVRDRLEGRGRHTVEVLFHLGPGVGGDMVSLDGALTREERAGEYHRGFGLTEEIVTVAGVWAGTLPVEFVSLVGWKDQLSE